MNYKKIFFYEIGFLILILLFLIHTFTSLFYIQNNEVKNGTISEITELLYAGKGIDIRQYHMGVQITLKNGTKIYAPYNETFTIHDYYVFKEYRKCGFKCKFMSVGIE